MTVVVSGASRGIGLALVEQYLSGGSEVIAICRDPASATGLDALRASHPTLTVLRGDVSNAASIAEAVTAIGDKPVELLLNVAGTLAMEFKPEDINFDTWAASFDVMITGPFRMLMALLPNLERARGKVVSVSSQIGASDWAVGGFYSYGAAKAGLNRAMKSLAVDLRDRGVTVAVVHPGYVKTDLGGPNAEISPEESARGIKQVADGLALDATGSFYNWNGTVHAW
jgi:NAD(P)-dependent dehydrogenase (short-subunit alcohol dehydrogenase family)